MLLHTVVVIIRCCISVVLSGKLKYKCWKACTLHFMTTRECLRNLTRNIICTRSSDHFYGLGWDEDFPTQTTDKAPCKYEGQVPIHRAKGKGSSLCVSFRHLLNASSGKNNTLGSPTASPGLNVNLSKWKVSTITPMLQIRKVSHRIVKY